jgi:hypothetical protein
MVYTNYEFNFLSYSSSWLTISMDKGSIAYSRDSLTCPPPVVILLITLYLQVTVAYYPTKLILLVTDYPLFLLPLWLDYISLSCIDFTF